MPVVIAALVSRNQIVTIEQPELHIHPAMQVNVADLFISRIQDEKAPLFLLETHSEHLILRMLRRIRETSENELPSGAPSLKPDQVSVLCIEPEEGTVRVLPLRIDETGDFIDRWPQGFFEERANELF
jgi:predicted ATPase